MEPNQPQNQPPLFELNVDMNANLALRSAASWAKVLAIVGFILGFFFVIAGILVQVAMNSNTYSAYGRNSSIVGNIGMVFYIIIGLIMIIGSIFSLNFSNRITTAVRTNDQFALSSGFNAARNYFAFWAVITIIFLLLCLLGVLGALSR